MDSFLELKVLRTCNYLRCTSTLWGHIPRIDDERKTWASWSLKHKYITSLQLSRLHSNKYGSIEIARQWYLTSVRNKKKKKKKILEG